MSLFLFFLTFQLILLYTVHCVQPIYRPDLSSTSGLESRFINHLEPVHNIRITQYSHSTKSVTHSLDQHSNHFSLLSFPTDGTSGTDTDPTNSRSTSNFGSSVRLEFSAFDHEFSLDLKRIDNLFSSDSVTLILDEHDSIVDRVENRNSEINSYWSRNTDSDWSTVTFHHTKTNTHTNTDSDSDNPTQSHTLSAVILKNGEMFQIDSVATLTRNQEFSNSGPQLMKQVERLEPSKLMIFKHSSIKDTTSTHQCSGLNIPGMTTTDSGLNQNNLHTDSAGSSSTNPSTSNRKLLSVEKWMDCFPGGNSQAYQLSVGVATDASYYTLMGSSSVIQSQITSQFATANLVYLQQLNIYLTIGDIVIYTNSGGTTPSWNENRASTGPQCTASIDSKLTSFSNWRNSVYPRRNSLWHMFTNCFPPPGTVGLAYIGVLCDSRYGVGISSVSTLSWLTFAHEIGHNFGATHTFQKGVGSTGGIMDYGDGRLPSVTGDYQFYTSYSKSEMCSNIGLALNTPNFTPFCFSAYTPKCGNGMVEQGEDCDDTSPCCTSQCKFSSGAKCSSGECCLNCQPAASNVLCNNNLGYCSNSQCVTSICSSYTALRFCGMVPGNSCRQRCQSTSAGSVCTDNYISPNLNVADGTVCSSTGGAVSVCKSGQCVSISTGGNSYTWSVSSWSSCNCNGQQTASVTCVQTNSDGQTGTMTVADTLCTTTKPATSQHCTPPTTCATYTWLVPAWSTCSTDCGGGIQIRALVCVISGTNTVVANNLCQTASNTNTAPAVIQKCNEEIQCPLKWWTHPWSECSTSCGSSGVQTRAETCTKLQNGVQVEVDRAQCVSELGEYETSRPCNRIGCGPYQWQYSGFNDCSESCGGGIQTRQHACVQTDTNSVVDNSLCNRLAEPVITQTCNSQACSSSYVWRSSVWSSCSAACNSGVQTRTAKCVESSTNLIVTDNECASTTSKPFLSQTCNTQPCVTYTWLTSSWSSCSEPCNGGLTNRNVTCVSSTGGFVPDSYCASLIRPSLVQQCNSQSCPVYSWLRKDWSSCSEQCGFGVQTREVICTASGSVSAVDDETMCSSSLKPTAVRTCNDGPCSSSGGTSLIVTDWSNCTQTCGSGYRTRPVHCVDSVTGAELPLSACSSSALPSTVSSCSDFDCPSFWFSSEWSECSVSCGGGYKNRKVECRLSTDPNGASVSENRCSGTKPSMMSSCNSQACPQWIQTNWSDCSVACDTGFEVAQLSCVGPSGAIMPDSDCMTSSIPATIRPCIKMPCPTWQLSSWSRCSAECGGGIETRDLSCRMPSDELWNSALVLNDSLCSSELYLSANGLDVSTVELSGISGRPITTRPCNTQPCGQYHYVWSVSECSVPCGGGTQTVHSTCIQTETNTAVSNVLCVGLAPERTRVCNNFTCPLYEFAVLSNWTECSNYCGVGSQTRIVNCRNLRPSTVKINTRGVETVDDKYCIEAGLTKPADWRRCSQPSSVCHGAVLGEYNGVCNELVGQCYCRSGYAGDGCTIKPRIWNAKTNADALSGSGNTNAADSTLSTSGVALGEMLTINWLFEGNFDTLSLLLMKQDDPSWPVAQYIAQDILITGEYSWQVGRNLPDLERGDNYFIRVYYSSTVYADTDTFSVSDPCFYTSCGLFGSCTLGGQCACLPGFSGPSCSIGPCDAALCGPEHSQCRNEKFILSGGVTSMSDSVCQCSDGYTGSQCRTKPGCSATCANGGDLTSPVTRARIAEAYNIGTTITTTANSTTPFTGASEESLEVVDNCGRCSCTNRWTGSTCSVCPIQCLNGGVADKHCQTCECRVKSGYFGPRCNCVYYELTMRVNVDAASLRSSRGEFSPAALQRVERTLVTDFAIAAGLATSEDLIITLESAKRDSQTQTKSDEVGLIVVLRLAKRCTSTSADNQDVTSTRFALMNARQSKQTNSAISSSTHTGTTTAASSTDSAVFPFAVSFKSAGFLRRRINNPPQHTLNTNHPNSGFTVLSNYAPLKLSLQTNSTQLLSLNSMPSASEFQSPFFTHSLSSKPSVPSPFAVSAVNTNGSLSLLDAYLSLMAMFENLDSAVYRGVVLSKIDTSYPIKVVDFTGTSNPPHPNSPIDPFIPINKTSQEEVLSLPAIVGVVIGMLVAALTSGLAVWYYRKQQHQKRTEEHSSRVVLRDQNEALMRSSSAEEANNNGQIQTENNEQLNVTGMVGLSSPRVFRSASVLYPMTRQQVAQSVRRRNSAAEGATQAPPTDLSSIGGLDQARRRSSMKRNSVFGITIDDDQPTQAPLLQQQEGDGHEEKENKSSSSSESSCRKTFDISQYLPPAQRPHFTALASSANHTQSSHRLPPPLPRHRPSLYEKLTAQQPLTVVTPAASFSSASPSTSTHFLPPSLPLQKSHVPSESMAPDLSLTQMRNNLKNHRRSVLRKQCQVAQLQFIADYSQE